jgi:hypothetical protein
MTRAAPTSSLVAIVAGRTARAAFVAVVVLSPLRGRIVVDERRTPPVYGEFTDVLLSAADVALVVLLVAWLVSLLAARRRVHLGPRYVTVPIAALLVLAAIGIPFSVDPALSAYTTLRYLVLVAFAVYVVNEIGGLRALIAPLVGMIGVQAVVGIGQVIAQRSLSLGRFRTWA